MKIYLDNVDENNKDTLFRLLEYSLFEESLYDGNEMNNNGLFNYDNFDDYFANENRKAFFIKGEGTNKLLGFVMINNHSIEEFMVIPKYRRNKIGKQAAFSCFDMYKGTWKVSPSIGSSQAYDFWNNIITEYTNNNYKFIDESFTFNNQ